MIYHHTYKKSMEYIFLRFFFITTGGTNATSVSLATTGITLIKSALYNQLQKSTVYSISSRVFSTLLQPQTISSLLEFVQLKLCLKR